MNLAAKLRLLLEWMPVLTAAQTVVLAPAGAARVRAALGVLDIIAQKTTTQEDDELIEMLRRVVMTEEGATLVDWLSDKVQSFFEEEADEPS